MSHKIRVLAAILAVALFGLAMSGAQENKEGKLGEADETGKMTMRGTMEDVPISELIQLYSEYSGRALVFDPKKISGNVTFVAPRDGISPTAEDALRAALSQFRLTLVSQGSFDEVVPAPEACTMAEVVTRETLKDMPALRPVRIVVLLRNVDATAARGALQNLLTRQGGVINPVVTAVMGNISNALIICDYAENVRAMLKLIDGLDSESSVESRVFRLKHVQAADIYTAVQAAGDFSAGSESNTMSVGMSEALNAIVVTGAAGSVDRVATVISALDVQSDD